MVAFLDAIRKAAKSCDRGTQGLRNRPYERFVVGRVLGEFLFLLRIWAVDKMMTIAKFMIVVDIWAQVQRGLGELGFDYRDLVILDATSSGEGRPAMFTERKAALVIADAIIPD